jgi:hypothetical protein
VERKRKLEQIAAEIFATLQMYVNPGKLLLESFQQLDLTGMIDVVRRDSADNRGIAHFAIFGNDRELIRTQFGYGGHHCLVDLIEQCDVLPESRL